MGEDPEKRSMKEIVERERGGKDQRRWEESRDAAPEKIAAEMTP